MGVDYFIFYTEASIICIAILVMLLINDRIYRTKQEKQVWFSRTVMAHIMYFTSDAFWAAVLSGQLPRIRPMVFLLIFSNYILLSLMAYEWTMYMGASENMPFRNIRSKRILCLLPMVLSTLIFVFAYAANPRFWISESGELNSLYYPMFIAAPTFYLLVAFAISMINALKTELQDEKKLYRLIGIYPLGVLGFGLVQTFILNAPIFCFGCTFMLLFFYIQNMQTLISVDALTRLNNRGQINRYMDQLQHRENVRALIMMIDIDHFKQINDTYGHAEGDHALIIVSEVLKKSCERLKTSAFLGRYGGDEFIVIIQNPDENETPERAAAVIRNTLAEKQKESQQPYTLEVSIGYDVLRDKNDTLHACLIRADEKLYKVKRERKR